MQRSIKHREWSEFPLPCPDRWGDILFSCVLDTSIVGSSYHSSFRTWKYFPPLSVRLYIDGANEGNSFKKEQLLLFASWTHTAARHLIEDITEQLINDLGNQERLSRKYSLAWNIWTFCNIFYLHIDCYLIFISHPI